MLWPLTRLIPVLGLPTTPRLNKGEGEGLRAVSWWWRWWTRRSVARSGLTHTHTRGSIQLSFRATPFLPLPRCPLSLRSLAKWYTGCLTSGAKTPASNAILFLFLWEEHCRIMAGATPSRAAFPRGGRKTLSHDEDRKHANKIHTMTAHRMLAMRTDRHKKRVALSSREISVDIELKPPLSIRLYPPPPPRPGVTHLRAWTYIYHIYKYI